jgi:hypothetical protein
MFCLIDWPVPTYRPATICKHNFPYHSGKDIWSSQRGVTPIYCVSDEGHVEDLYYRKAKNQSWQIFLSFLLIRMHRTVSCTQHRSWSTYCKKLTKMFVPWEQYGERTLDRQAFYSDGDFRNFGISFRTLSVWTKKEGPDSDPHLSVKLPAASNHLALW